MSPQSPVRLDQVQRPEHVQLRPLHYIAWWSAGGEAVTVYRLEAQECQHLVDEPGVPLFAAAAPAVAANAPAVAGTQEVYDRNYFDSGANQRPHADDTIQR